MPNAINRARQNHEQSFLPRISLEQTGTEDALADARQKLKEMTSARGEGVACVMNRLWYNMVMK